ncbi:MAG: hypothetical protein C4289_12510, partial [Chloroflexota bacterium]
WRTARRLRPEAALAAYVFVAWNPLALYEAAANAHNDLLMVFATALALELGARRRWALALPALTLGVLTKYVVGLLGPLFLIESAATARARIAPRPLRPPRSVWLGGAFAVALAVVLYAPFWNGWHTFDAVTSASGDMLSSPGWLLRQALKHRFGWEGAKWPVMLLLSTVFVTGYGLLLMVQALGGLGRGVAFPSLMGASLAAVTPRERGTAMGVFQAVYALGMTLGPATAGVIADRLGVSGALWISGLVTLLATAVAG